MSRNPPPGTRFKLGRLQNNIIILFFFSILLQCHLTYSSNSDLSLPKSRVGASDHGYSSGKGDDTQSTANLFKDVISFFSNANEWIWPQDSRDGIPPHLHSILVSWCGDTYEDAMVEAQRKSEQFDQLKLERDALRLDVINRRNEFTSKEQELKSECDRSMGLVRNSFELTLSKTKSDHLNEKSQLKVDLEACELKVRRHEETVCDKQKLLGEASWKKRISDCETELNACNDRSRSFNSTYVSRLESSLLSIQEEKKVMEFRNKRLSAEVAECRPSKAAFEARLKEVLADGTIASLEKAIFRLQNLVLFLFSVLIGLSVLLFYVLQVSGDSLPLLSSLPFLQQSPALSLSLSLSILKDEEAKGQLQTMYEFRNGKKTKPILVASSENSTLFFLLLPLDLSNSRCFSLFGSHGDYSSLLEKAQELVGKESGAKQVVVVLYESSGSLFSQNALQKLNLTAENVAHRSLPDDSDSPSKDHVVVTWLSKMEGLNVANSEGDSSYLSYIRTQAWASYLLERSGRYGDVYANNIKDE